MNIAIVNSVSDRSTGKIASGLQEYLNKQGHSCYLCYGHGKKIKKKNTYRIDTVVEHYVHALLCRITGIQGVYSSFATIRLISFLRKNKISVIYGIGLHGYYLNEKMFYKYIIKDDISFVYIMTEEYAFLGKCGYSNGCTNYLNGCGNCPQIKEYPKSLFFDRTKEMFKIKKFAYAHIKRKVFVGPEYTILAGKKSPLLRGIKTEIIDEAINVDFYKPRKYDNLLEELRIDANRIIILCIAPLSYERKGVRFFIELAKKFEGNNRYIFVHVGYDSNNKADLPGNLLVIGYESDQNRLAMYYSMADLFVFPSLLDTMPNACLEALACGTPLLCFNTSGMPFLGDDTVATFVDEKNVEKMAEVVRNTGKKQKSVIDCCRKYAVKRYDNKLYYKKLLDLAISLEEKR